MRFFLAIAVLLFSLPLPVMAQDTPPTPMAHPVKGVENELKAREAREKKLRAELKKIKSDLSSKKSEMIKVAKDIKDNESNLLNLEQRIAQRAEEQKTIEERLEEDRGALSDLVLALERVRRVPPEALIARPGAPLETAQSAMLLQSILPRLYKRAERLKIDLASLQDIIEGLKKDRNKVIETSKNLEDSQKKLNALLSQRESLYAQTAKDVKKQQAELKEISLQARNLKDLVARIERKQKAEDKRREEEARQARQNARNVPARASYARTPIPKTGESQLPISGVIKVGYGKSDDIGAVSQGLHITGRDNALVVAPMGGVVDYAGYFKGYGEIIILKHQKGYHSLIAGLGKIDTVVGRAVTAGEPIGKMGISSDEDGSALYYELRYKGQPVNPSKRISGLR